MTPSNLQHGVGQQQAVADVVQEAGVGAADGVVLEDLLGGFRLARAALPRDEDEVVVELAEHGAEHVVGQSVAGGNTQSGGQGRGQQPTEPHRHTSSWPSHHSFSD